MTNEIKEWWDEEQNQTTISIPIAVIQDEGIWVACTNDDTKKRMGDYFSGVCEGKTKEEAIRRLLSIIKSQVDYYQDGERRYKCWVPFRRGPWQHAAGRWISIFGINIYFRYGKGMKGGRYIPFTKLNIRIYNEWLQYKN